MADDELKKASGSKGIIIVLIALIVILIIGMGVGAYLLLSSGVLNGNQGQNQIVKQESTDSSKTYKVAINDLVLNITNAKGREKLMKLSFHLKSTEPSIESIVEEYKPEIVDAVIAQISARSSEELLTVGGKALLKEELMEDINNIINEVTSNDSNVQRNNIKDILFTTFVIK